MMLCAFISHSFSLGSECRLTGIHFKETCNVDIII